MNIKVANWKTQIRKGYLELCILQLIKQEGRLYGAKILSALSKLGHPVKEGTLYPLLKRMTDDKFLAATWETNSEKGHPRKYYVLTNEGLQMLAEMITEFKRMTINFEKQQEAVGNAQ